MALNKVVLEQILHTSKDIYWFCWHWWVALSISETYLNYLRGVAFASPTLLLLLLVVILLVFFLPVFYPHIATFSSVFTSLCIFRIFLRHSLFWGNILFCVLNYSNYCKMPLDEYMAVNFTKKSLKYSISSGLHSTFITLDYLHPTLRGTSWVWTVELTLLLSNTIWNKNY